jgi:hypothetical protein
MHSRDDTACACRQISGELVDMVGWLSEGDLTADEFRHTVAALEARKLQRFGFCLTSAVGENGIVHFSLRSVANGELCASIDADPKAGTIEIQHACT